MGINERTTLKLEELQRFRDAMDISGDAIYLVDRATMRFVDVNRTACLRMGYSREELLQMGPQDLLDEKREKIEKLYDEVIAAGAAGSTMQSTARTRDGRASVTELHRRALLVDEGWVIVSIARDITQRRQMEQALLESERRYRATFELAGSGIAHVDLDGRFLRVNESLCRLLGFPERELIGRTVKDLSHPEDRDLTDAARSQVRSGERKSMRAEKRYLRKDGVAVWVVLTVALVRDDNGVPLYEIAVFDDVTVRRQAEQASRDSAAELRLFADNAPALTVLWDADLRCRFANRRYAEFFGTTVERIAGRHLREVVGEDIYREIECHFSRALQGHAVNYQRIHQPVQGEARHTEVRLLPHLGEDGQILGVFSVIDDITQHKQTEERIRHVAHHHSLTRLPNRLLFNDRLAQAIRFARRDKRKFALLYLDLDRFKPVNDTLGHAAGDELLRIVAKRIRGQVRESDTVARIGGDEFTVILADVALREDAQAVAAKMAAALAEPFLLDNQSKKVEIGASIGIAVYPLDAQDADALAKVADASMYQGKQTRKQG